MIRVLVVGDVTAPRLRLCVRLAPARGIEVLGHGAFDGGLPRFVDGIRVDVVVLHLPVGDHGAALSRRECPDGVRVVVVGSRADDAGLLAALRAGASGFVRPDANGDELAAVIRAAAGGKQLPNAAGLGDLMTALRRPPPSPPPTRWSAVERQMVELIAAGAANSEVAAALGFHPATTLAHVNLLMARVGAPGLMQLILHAYDHGLIAAGADRSVAGEPGPAAGEPMTRLPGRYG